MRVTKELPVTSKTEPIAKAPKGKHRLALRIRVIIAVVVAGLLDVGYVAASIYVYGVQTTQSSAQAAIVLGASVRGEEPSPVFRERINHAIVLYHAGNVRKVIFTGGVGSGNIISDSEVAKRYAVRQGVPAADILTECKSHTTFENLRYAQQVAHENRLDTFLIVSDPLHMKRAMAMATDIGLRAWPSPTPTSAYKTLANLSAFLARETYFYILYRLGLGAER